MKAIISFIILTALFNQTIFLNAQTENAKFGAGVLVGGAKLFGDIEETNTSLTGGLFLRYSPFSFFAISTKLTYGTMTSGLDAVKTTVFNTSFSGTFFFLQSSKYRPFLTIGLSNFHFSTKDENNQQFYYSDSTAVSGWDRALQIGAGFELFTGQQWAINTFGDYTITGMDELDAISQGKDDGFFRGMIGLMYYFNKDSKTIDDDKFNESWKYIQKNIEADEYKNDKSTTIEKISTAKPELFADGIYFVPGSAKIHEKSKPQLQKIYRHLLTHPKEEIELLAANNELENGMINARAKAIKNYLVKLGIKASRILIGSNPAK